MRPLVNNLGSSLTKNTCSLNISQIPNVFPRSGHSMALFKLKCDLFSDSPDLCSGILTQFLGASSQTLSISLKKTKNLSVFRFHDGSHPRQTKGTMLPVLSKAWEQLSLKSEHHLTEINPLLSPLSFYYRATFLKILTRWFVFESQQGDQFSHLITRQGIWEVSAIKWSGAIK